MLDCSCIDNHCRHPQAWLNRSDQYTMCGYKARRAHTKQAQIERRQLLGIFEQQTHVEYDRIAVHQAGRDER